MRQWSFLAQLIREYREAPDKAQHLRKARRRLAPLLYPPQSHQYQRMMRGEGPRIYYAGIGARKAPASILIRMSGYARELEERGFILRSGGAPGPDSAFERGVKDERHKHIYLPWKGFNGKTGIVVGDREDLARIAKVYHPAWGILSRGERALHTRNVAEILGHGATLEPVEFVLCWTESARGGGGTGQALRIAKAYGVPVYDLADVSNTFEKDWLS